MDYLEFLNDKSHINICQGFIPLWMPEFLFDFQLFLVDWAIRQGRSAMFVDCGLGKTPMQLVWAENVVRKTNKSVLIVAPLAVAAQTMREGNKFGIDVIRSNDGTVKGKITITNYEKLHLFQWQDFVGVVCDESSRIKSADAKTRAIVTEFMKKIQYRLLCTATAAPNDYLELGTSSEALGYLGFIDMLNKFFKNQNNNSGLRQMYGESPKWLFRGHAEKPFWRWVCSWARAARSPSDIGFEDGKFILPPLIEKEHIVEARTLADGMLFALPAGDLREQREERKRTIQERCECVAMKAHTDRPVMIWCHLNEEGDRLQSLISGSIQISGKDSDESKEEKFLNFIDGECRVLITKPKIGAFGLNFQHCNHVITFPSHSYEQYYQSVRRCWRFGQTLPVTVEMVATEGERKVLANVARKSKAADTMFGNLIHFMNNSMSVQSNYQLDYKGDMPSWISKSKP